MLKMLVLKTSEEMSNHWFEAALPVWVVAIHLVLIAQLVVTSGLMAGWIVMRVRELKADAKKASE